MENEVDESEFINTLIDELPQYGIDTSKWEYDYGDCCYGGAIEFIALCIKGYLSNHLEKLFLECEHGDEEHRKWLKNKFNDYLQKANTNPK